MKMPSTIGILSFLACVFGSQFEAEAQITYVWTGAVDGDWQNVGNWDGSGVPADNNPASAPLTFAKNSGDVIVFNAAGAPNPVPTSNIPALGGSFISGEYDTPWISFLFGDLSFTIQSNNGGAYWGGNNITWLTVGDGDVGNGAANLTINNLTVFNRNGGTQSITVNADGTLIFPRAGGFQMAASNNRPTSILLNGGRLVSSGPVTNMSTAAGFVSQYVDFTAAGASFTAAFGGNYADLAAVEADIGSGLSFRSSTSLELAATDNADGTFTVSTPSASVPFDITAIVYDASADTVTLTWRAQADKTYVAKYSSDMTDWSADMGDSLGPVLDEVSDDGDQITVTFGLTEFRPQNGGALFFRIEEE